MAPAEDAPPPRDAGVLPRRTAPAADHRSAVLRPRDPARARDARDTRASKLLMEDRRILSAEEKTEDLEQDIALIAQEFRGGFEAVDKIVQPAVTIFGSARIGRASSRER